MIPIKTIENNSKFIGGSDQWVILPNQPLYFLAKYIGEFLLLISLAKINGINNTYQLNSNDITNAEKNILKKVSFSFL